MTAAEDRNAASDSDSSSDSDAEADVPDVSQADMGALLALEAALAADPNAYDSHVQYIALLRKARLRERLRAARRVMQKHFPLTEQLWSDWLEDEAPGAAAAEMRRLFELAVTDYLSIPLWRRYLEYERDHLAPGDAAAQEQYRALYERALGAGGLHVTQGAQLWSLAREWEALLLAANPADEKQQERVRSLWQRQLQVPLADSAQTLEQYRAWEAGGLTSGEVAERVLQGQKKAAAAATLRRANEAAVAPGKPADHDLLAAYNAYLRLEEAHGDPMRVKVIYERAVAAFPVTHHLWLQYGRFVEAKLHDTALAANVYERAARNCPWVGAVWARLLAALERSGATDEDHAAAYHRALAAGLQTSEDCMEVVLARIDAVRRRCAEDPSALRQAFTNAAQALQSAYGEVHDPALRLTAYRADCEAHLAKDMPAARAVWEAALKGAAGRHAETWVGYIAMERALRNIPQARTLYKRCYTRRFADGSQLAMCQAWLRFEREEGSAEDHLQACLKVEPILNEAAAAAAAAADAENAARSKAAVEKAPALSKEDMRRLRQQKDPNFTPGAGKEDGAQAGQKRRQNAQSAQRPKRLRTGGSEAAPAQPQTAATAAAAPEATPAASSVASDAAAAGRAEGPSPMQTDQRAAPQGGPAPAAGAGTAPTASANSPPAATADGGDKRTAFVRNFDHHETDDELRDFFAEFGAVQQLRRPREPNGRSKGFAYVEFAERAGLEAAVAKDGVEHRGRGLQIAESKPPAPRGGGRSAGGRGGGRGRGGRDGGGGHGREGPLGLGGGAGRAGWGGSAAGKQHQKMDLKGGPRPGLGFTPRAVAVRSTPEGTRNAVRSNAEFRKEMLEKKKE